jgi:hypothetical protein
LILDGCYFTGLVWFWLIYAKVSGTTMSWKQTTQNSFADSLVVEHKSLSGLDDVHNIINWTEIEQTLSNLNPLGFLIAAFL